MAIDVVTKQVNVIVNEPAIDLDPTFSPDGKSIYYSSAVNGSINLWKIDIATKTKSAVTKEVGLRRRPSVLPGSDKLVFLNKSGSYNSIELIDLTSSNVTTLVEDRITSQGDMTVSPDGVYMAYTWPYDGGYEFRMLDLATPNTSILLARGESMPLAPAFDAVGEWIYFAEATDSESTSLKRVSSNGGSTETIAVKKWNWGEETGSLKITSKVDGVVEPVRMNISDARGHPLIPGNGTIHSDGQNGRVFFYSNGEIEISGIAGEVTISAVQGFATKEVVVKTNISAGTTTVATI